MAFNDIEIEVKLRAPEETLDELDRRLLESARFVGETLQIDEYFSPTRDSFVGVQFPYKWLSIRKRDGASKLNFKHFHPEGAEQHTHCDEYESVVDNPEAIRKALEACGVETVVVVRKRRRMYVCDGFEIALDRVEGLGGFVEIEAAEDLGGITGTRAALERKVSELGLQDCTVDYRGYPFQLLAAQGLLK